MFTYLIGRQKDVVSVPLDGRRRVGLDVALEIGVELEGLADSLPNDFDGGRELDFDVNVTTSADADDVGGDAVVCAAMVFVDKGKVQHVSFVHRPGEKKNDCFLMLGI